MRIEIDKFLDFLSTDLILNYYHYLSIIIIILLLNIITIITIIIIKYFELIKVFWKSKISAFGNFYLCLKRWKLYLIQFKSNSKQ